MSVAGILSQADVMFTTLSHLQIGEKGVVETIESGVFENGLAVRLRALGLRQSHEVTMIRQGWFGGPFIVRAGKATEIAIRRTEAALVVVRKV